MTCENLPSGSKVVSSTKLKEGRARDKVAMVTKTRQMKRPQLTMVTVPIPGPLPYLHVDGNPTPHLFCTFGLMPTPSFEASPFLGVPFEFDSLYSLVFTVL